MHAHTQRVNTWSVVFIVFFYYVGIFVYWMIRLDPGYLHWHVHERCLCRRSTYNNNIETTIAAAILYPILKYHHDYMEAEKCTFFRPYPHTVSASGMSFSASGKINLR